MSRAEADQDLARRVSEQLPWLKAATEAKNLGEVRMYLNEANRLLEECIGRLALRTKEAPRGQEQDHRGA